MERPFFTFIIPVFNVEQYLNECVDSILCRNIEDYEIILVNDGSTDSSGKICDALAAHNNCVTVINKNNGGLSDARNVGILNASGDYILFVDSDDYIDSSAITELKYTIENNNYPDVVFLEAMKLFPDGSKKSMGDGYTHEGIDGKAYGEVLHFLQGMSKFPGSACTKALKLTMFDNGLLFEKGLISEDNEWTLRLLKSARSFAYCDRKYYFYRQQRNGSISSKSSIKMIRSIIFIIEKHSYEIPGTEYELFCNSSCSYFMIILLLQLQKLEADKVSKKKLYREVQKYLSVMKYASTKKEKLVATFCKLFGLKLTGKFLSVYQRKVK